MKTIILDPDQNEYDIEATLIELDEYFDWDESNVIRRESINMDYQSNDPEEMEIELWDALRGDSMHWEAQRKFKIPKYIDLFICYSGDFTSEDAKEFYLKTNKNQKNGL
jgi:hypothetical protein